MLPDSSGILAASKHFLLLSQTLLDREPGPLLHWGNAWIITRFHFLDPLEPLGRLEPAGSSCK